MSQQAIADQLGIAQQILAHYDVGRLRMPASLLPRLAQLFGVRGDDLLGLSSTGPGKRGPTPGLQHQMERLHHLPKAKQKVGMEMLDVSVRPERPLIVTRRASGYHGLRLRNTDRTLRDSSLP